MRIGVADGDTLQQLPFTITIHLYFSENTLVARVVRELEHRDILGIAVHFKRGVLSVVKGLNADASHINSYQTQILCGCVSAIIGYDGLQRYLTCTGAKTAKVEAEREVFVACARCLLGFKGGDGLLGGTVDERHLHDTVVVLHAAYLRHTHNGRFGYEATACLFVQWVFFPLHGNDGSTTATSSSAYGKLLLVANGVTCRVHHSDLYNAFSLGVYLQVCGDEVVAATSGQGILTAFL